MIYEESLKNKEWIKTSNSIRFSKFEDNSKCKVELVLRGRNENQHKFYKLNHRYIGSFLYWFEQELDIAGKFYNQYYNKKKKKEKGLEVIEC